MPKAEGRVFEFEGIEAVQEDCLETFDFDSSDFDEFFEVVK